MFEIVVKRIGGVPLTMGKTHDMLNAYQVRNELVSFYQRTGFAGKRNTAGVWRLAKRDGGKRVRLAVYVVSVPTPVCWN